MKKKSGKDNKFKEIISTDIISLSEKKILSYYSKLTSASKEGLIFHSYKHFFSIPQTEFSKFLNQPVEIFLSHYKLPFFGILKNISEIKKGVFEINISFTKETPFFYRECVEDLLN